MASVGRRWCPEVGLIFLDVFFAIVRKMKSRFPKPTSGHLDRLFSFRCPEVSLGIPNLTSGHFGSCRETWNFLVSAWVCAKFIVAAAAVARRFFDASTI